MRVRVLYGEMGAGKNYSGERLSETLGVPFLDGDDVIPDPMRQRIAAFKIVTPEMIENYISLHLAPAILRLAKKQDVVVAQALYLKRHRELLEWLLKGAGHEVEFFHIRVPFLQHVRQLLSRDQGWRWLAFALLNKPFFQS